MASLPSDRTKLALAQSNQNPGIAAGSSQNKNAITEAYDTIDLLNQKVDSLVGSSTLSPYPPAQYNKLINGGFAVNQRAVSGTVTLAAGAYGHDRWKAGASGCTYTFSTTNNVTTITITAGSLIQVIEGINFASGTHTLSWTGTSQGKIGAGVYSVSGVNSSVVGGTNLSIEFNIGTLSIVQFNFGGISLPFQPKLLSQEEDDAFRYNYRISSTQFYPAFGVGQAISTTQALIFVPLRRKMRLANPTLTRSGNMSLRDSAGNHLAVTAVSLDTNTGRYDGVMLIVTVASGLAAGNATTFQGSNDTTAYLNFDCEI